MVSCSLEFRSERKDKIIWKRPSKGETPIFSLDQRILTLQYLVINPLLTSDDQVKLLLA